VETTRRSADDLLDVARALLLLQGSILVATTIEALVWATVFPGASGSPVLMSCAAAVVILVGRTRLGDNRRWVRRLIYLVEGTILLTAAVNIAIGLALAHSLPPAVALFTQAVLPLSVIVLLRWSARLARTAATPSSGALEAAA
jgi:hypothetical protein